MRPQYASTDPAPMISIGGVLMLLLFILIPITLISAIVRYFRAMAEERRRLRLDVGKLAHELESLREDLAGRATTAAEPSTGSGK